MAVDLGRSTAPCTSACSTTSIIVRWRTCRRWPGVITTGEGLARAFWRLLAPAVPAGALRRVTVVETAKNRFEYGGEAA